MSVESRSYLRREALKQAYELKVDAPVLLSSFCAAWVDRSRPYPDIRPAFGDDYSSVFVAAVQAI